MANWLQIHINYFTPFKPLKDAFVNPWSENPVFWTKSLKNRQKCCMYSKLMKSSPWLFLRYQLYILKTTIFYLLNGQSCVNLLFRHLKAKKVSKSVLWELWKFLNLCGMNHCIVFTCFSMSTFCHTYVWQISTFDDCYLVPLRQIIVHLLKKWWKIEQAVITSWRSKCEY